jgi:hypothetical protein
MRYLVQRQDVRTPAAAVAVLGVTVAAAMLLAAGTRADQPQGNQLTFPNASGVQRTVTTNGAVDRDNPFFQDIGTNGRACVTCHQPDEGWTITPSQVQDRFEKSGGLDPIFRTNDGSTCEGADVSTLDSRRNAFRMLLTKGLIRVGLQVPSDAEFEIVDVDDPYACGALFDRASLFRRPLPSTNLRFLSAVMWDGRETVPGQSIRADLMGQAVHATTGHAEGAEPSADQLNAIVDFESSLYTAQVFDNNAGNLSTEGASGGPKALTTQPFCIGINDPLNMLPSMPGACATPSGGLDPNVFTLFSSWADSASARRRSIARGQQIFNTRTFVIDNVGGLNGAPADPVSGPIQGGTCTLCHDAPNAGDHSVSMALDLGITDAAQRTPDLPLYTLRNKTTGETRQTTDPGRAMVTGRWADIGKFKGPVLRGLAGRSPYFHNGAAATLDEAVDFYDTRFHINLTRREKADLTAFLGAL